MIFLAVRYGHIGKSLNLVLGQQEGSDGGEMQWLFNFTYIFLKLYFLYIPGTVLGIKFGSNKDDYVI